VASKRRHLGRGRPKGASRPRKKRYLIVTNGEVTERQYFDGLEEELGGVVFTVRSFRADPAALAKTARDLKRSEERGSASDGRSGTDGFQHVFVVTDVDRFTPAQLQEARRICRESGMELVISNPCFEVWLIDHLMRCPDSFVTARDVERKATDLGIVGGSRNKHVNYQVLEGRYAEACTNARAHNSSDRGRMRTRLDDLHFGPWTDMPDLIDRIARHKRV
jgi:hypothetical protein